MQKKDAERMAVQRDQQFKLLKNQWDEMIREKGERQEIEKIFK